MIVIQVISSLTKAVRVNDRGLLYESEAMETLARSLATQK